MGFLFSLLGNVLLNRFYLGWARREINGQISEMQNAAFDSPGFASPLPMSVLAAGGTLLVGQIALGRGVWKLSTRQALLSLFLGAVLNITAQLLAANDGQ
jgi:hypothetical protein